MAMGIIRSLLLGGLLPGLLSGARPDGLIAWCRAQANAVGRWRQASKAADDDFTSLAGGT
jgi:hypothetical protein